MTKEQKLALIQKIRNQAERKYKKIIAIAVVVSLLVGIALGMASCMTGIVDPYLLSPTPVPTAVPTPEPTPEPEYYPGDKELPIADGEVYTFDAQIADTGTPRYVAGAGDNYMTANISIAAARLMTPLYFNDKYGKQYKLTGTEAGVQVDIKLNSVSGTEVAFCPQDALVITLESADGVVDGGFQLIDSEIDGNYGVTVTPGEAKTYYKRFTWNDASPMKYLVVQYYYEGEARKVYFALTEDAVITDALKSDEQIAAEQAAAAASEGGENATGDAPVVTAPNVTANPEFPTLGKGQSNKKSHVELLQKQLIKLGYMEGKADGDYGSKTEDAVKKAQAALGLEQNGVADPLFLTLLFMDNAPQAGAEAPAAAPVEPSAEPEATEEPVD